MSFHLDAGMRPKLLQNVGIWEKKRLGARFETKSLLARAKGMRKSLHFQLYIRWLTLNMLFHYFRSKIDICINACTGWSIWSRTHFCWHWNNSCTLVCTTAKLLIWCQQPVFRDQMDHTVRVLPAYLILRRPKRPPQWLSVSRDSWLTSWLRRCCSGRAPLIKSPTAFCQCSLRHFRSSWAHFGFSDNDDVSQRRTIFLII